MNFTYFLFYFFQILLKLESTLGFLQNQNFLIEQHSTFVAEQTTTSTFRGQRISRKSGNMKETPQKSTSSALFSGSYILLYGYHLRNFIYHWMSWEGCYIQKLERVWEKAVMSYFKVLCDICLERQENYKNISQYRQCPGLGLNVGHFSTK